MYNGFLVFGYIPPGIYHSQLLEQSGRVFFFSDVASLTLMSTNPVVVTPAHMEWVGRPSTNIDNGYRRGDSGCRVGACCGTSTTTIMILRTKVSPHILY